MLGVTGCEDSRDELGAAPGSTHALRNRPNVILITIDTLRADRLALHGYGEGHTPNLTRLANRGVVFERGRSHAPITLPSHASILTGLYPPQHGARTNGNTQLSREHTTLAERLKAVGYRTGAFVSAFVLDSRFGLDQGFDHYDDDLEDGRTKWSSFGVKDRRAGTTVDRAIAWLDEPQAENEDPTFVWLHLYDPHYDYDPPAPFNSLAEPYDGEIAYADAQLARLLGHLELQGRLDDSLVIVTSDHGESFGEHGEQTHSLFVYEATQHVPMIVQFPNRAHAGKRSPATARHIDIVPTVLSVLGVDTSEPLVGRSLLSAVEAEEPAWMTESYAEAILPQDQFGWSPLFALEQDGFKYIAAPRPELYDLRQDQHERTDLSGLHEEQTATMADTLEAMLAKIDPAPTSHDEMSPATRAQLAALGYINPESIREEDRGRDPKDMIEVHTAQERMRRSIDAGKHEHALKLGRSLLRIDPRNPSVARDVAACLAELGRWEEAIEAYQFVHELAPNESAAWIGLAKVRFRGLRDFDEAARDLERAAALRPDDPALDGIRGDLLHEQGRFVEAEQAYRRAIEAGEQSPSYLLGWSSALNRLGQLDAARDAVERAIRLDPSNPIAHFNHGVILHGVGLSAAARGALTEASRLDPNATPAQQLLASIVSTRH